MKTHTTTEHTLQSSTDGKDWKNVVAGMFALAQKLANQGQLTEALRTAKIIHSNHYGYTDSLLVEFRIQSTAITTITEYEWLNATII